ncbi:APC family permease [Jhaorihella thermophila]|uniref:Amino acid transporter n=1 Tax=Jhaorihella thermophila TaxID=488547 RepID=A0A1H5TY51_9RHOB|nr:amino acid permease [Jhaorihella thermophila]SEF67802.1 Amino acid transporter [Jhaorihella thermophila]
MTEGHLKRRIGLGLLTAYGVGVMVGSGIYVLVGAIAGQAGVWAPVSFLIAGLIAAPAALSYAEFSTRLPEAAGEAAYVAQGLRSPALALLVGLGIVASGTISAGAVLRGGAGYLADGFGVLESLAFAAIFTAVELLGLVLVIWAGFTATPSADWTAPAAPVWSGIGVAAVLAFFAFIGFEDIVNMAEETHDPTRTLPRAILISLAITATIYALVAWAAVRAVPLGQLAASDSPLALVWQTSRGDNAAFLSAIAVFAALNGVLAQIVMAARVLFGLGRRTPALAIFHHAHPRFGTPVAATLLIGTLVILAALFVRLTTLAEMTSAILLGVFTLVNLALILEKRREPDAPFRTPFWVPVAGAILSAGGLLFTLGAGS